MNEHTPEQLQEKRVAIDIAIAMFINGYKGGRLADDAALFHTIENLNQLVIEYKRG